jgi:hypothetical protein
MINWQEEIIKLIHEYFKNRGIYYKSNSDIRDCLIDFMNLQAKLIKPLPRIVFKSKEIKTRKTSFEEAKALHDIKIKIEKGIDITYHMSKKMLDPSYNDLLFNDWLVHHIHLSNTRHQQNQRFYNRTGNVLFAAFNNTHAFLIDIKAHGKNGEPNAFAKKELLEIMHNNWPELLKEYEDFTLLHNPSDEEIQLARQAGVTFGITEVNGKSFFNPGIGITTSGHNVHTIKRANEVLRIFYRMVEYIETNSETIINEISVKTGYRIKELDLCVSRINTWPFFVFFERNSKLEL